MDAAIAAGRESRDQYIRRRMKMEDIASESDEDHTADVDRPPHYTRWKIEPVTYVMRNDMEFWRGNIIKYASRAGFKSQPGKTAVEAEITDLQKVIRYAEMRINQLNGKAQL